MNVSNMVQEGHKQHSCQRRTSLPYELSFPSFKTNTSWSFCFSIWTATFRKSEVFSNLFPFISYCILTLPLSNLHINVSTDLLAELPLPKIASFFLISLRGNEKCSESGSGSAAVYVWTWWFLKRAPHMSWVGVCWSSLMWMNVRTSPWRVEGKWFACMFSCFGALDTTKIWFKLLCCLFACVYWLTVNTFSFYLKVTLSQNDICYLTLPDKPTSSAINI